MNKELLKAQAVIGAAWLDRNGPKHWWNMVDTHTLNQQRSDACVIGQLSQGKFTEWLRDRNVYPHRGYFGFASLIGHPELPFYETYRSAMWSALTQYWIEQIQKRRDER